ncbi:MAG: CPBP family intramembrane metalloprotease [Candidatus Neomarinimicrobiota bacterium]|nr:MAG: CPBP family intramembrane metalloprotease [Candidatus Neomarinimicrobiota bacterium]
MNGVITAKTAFALVLISVLTAFGLGSAVTPLANTWFRHPNSLFLSFLSILIGQGCMIVPVLFFLARKKLSLADTLRIRPIPWSTAGAVLLLSVGVVIWMDELDRLIAILLPLPDYLADLNESLTIDSLASALLIGTALLLLAPLGEELLFRGFLQQTLERTWPDLTRAVLITALFFAFIHLNPYWMIQIYLLAVLLGYLAWRANSIWPSFLLHLVNNALALLFTNLDESTLEGPYLWRGHVSPLWLGGATLLAVAGYRWFHQTLEEVSP